MAARPSSPPVTPGRPLNGAATARPHATEPDLTEWRAILASVQRQRPALASVLEHAAPLALGPERVVLGYEANSFLFKTATEPAARELLAGALRAHFGRAVQLEFETIVRGSAPPTVAQLDSADRKARVDAARRAVAEHPLVMAAIELLGAELKDVRLAQDALDA